MGRMISFSLSLQISCYVHDQMVEVLDLGQLVFLGKLMNQLEQVCQIVLVQTPTVLHLQEEALNVVEI